MESFLGGGAAALPVNWRALHGGAGRLNEPAGAGFIFDDAFGRFDAFFLFVVLGDNLWLEAFLLKGEILLRLIDFKNSGCSEGSLSLSDDSGSFGVKIPKASSSALKLRILIPNYQL